MGLLNIQKSLIIFTLVNSFSTKCFTQTENFNITGKIAELDEGEKIVVSLKLADRELLLDSDYVKHGIFKLTGALIDGPRLVSIRFSNHRYSYLVLLINNENVTITSKDSLRLPAGNIRDLVKIEGSRAANNYLDLEPLFGSYYIFSTAINQKIKSESYKNNFSYKFIEGVNSAREIFNNTIFRVVSFLIEKDSKNAALPFLINDQYNVIGKEAFLKDLYNILDSSIKNTYYGKQLEGFLQSCKGQKAPDASLVTETGRVVHLNEIIKSGKLTLVYFWDPISLEKVEGMNSELLEAFKKYHDFGLNIVGVSVNKDRGIWRNSLKQTNNPWFHVSDLKGASEGIAKMYSFAPTIWPFNVLISSEGEIVDWQVEGAMLKYYLETWLATEN